MSALFMNECRFMPVYVEEKFAEYVEDIKGNENLRLKLNVFILSRSACVDKPNSNNSEPFLFTVRSLAVRVFLYVCYFHGMQSSLEPFKK